MSSLDSQDIDDLESCRLTVQGDTSVVRTEASQHDHNEMENYKEIRKEKNKAGENRLA